MEIGRVVGGHYLIQRLIKQGQYATVYQGVESDYLVPADGFFAEYFLLPTCEEGAFLSEKSLEL